MFEPSILVLDADAHFLECLKKDFLAAISEPEKSPLPMALLFEPVGSRNIRETLGVLTNKDRPLEAIFLNPSALGSQWRGFISQVQRYRSNTPVFLLTDLDPGVSPDELKRLGIAGRVHKPADYFDLAERVRVMHEVK